MSFFCQLVKLEDSSIGMQVKLGQFTATQSLPDNLATYTKEELQSYFQEKVPEMLKGLQEMERNHRRKLNKRAENASVVPQFDRKDTGQES